MFASVEGSEVALEMVLNVDMAFSTWEPFVEGWLPKHAEKLQ